MIGRVLNWADLRLPSSSARVPLKKQPNKAPTRHMLTAHPEKIKSYSSASLAFIEDT